MTTRPRHDHAHGRTGARGAAKPVLADSVSALERGFRVLHCFSPGVPALTHQQIVHGTGLPKSTVSRVTQTLVKLGYLDASHADGRYRLTAKTLDIGHIYLANMDVRSMAYPLMSELAQGTQATVNLAVRSGDQLVVIETVRSETAAVSINSRIGFQFPVLQTAIGRAYIAGLEPGTRAAAIRSLRSTVAAHEWKAMQARVQKALDECDEHGYCILRGEWRKGVNSVAAPLRTGNGELHVLNCAGPALDFDPDSLAEVVGPRLLAIVRHIEAATNVSWQIASPSSPIKETP